MTENVGDSGLRFEIWFRRRKSQDTFILQASSAEVKAVWTAIIGKILWRQALRNRGNFDLNVNLKFKLLIPCKTKVLSLKIYFFLCILALRMQEMVSMGIGSKPFMDIKPSDAAISDRAIDYIMKGSGEPFLYTYFSLSTEHFEVSVLFIYFIDVSENPYVKSFKQGTSQPTTR